MPGKRTDQSVSLDELCADCKKLDDQWELGPDNEIVLACPACFVQRLRQAQAVEGRDTPCSTGPQQI